MGTGFAWNIQVVCLAALTAILLYTLWLSRYKGLDAHVTVRWVLLQGVAILAVILWPWLPFLRFTSRLQDRGLLLVTTVVLFAFVVFLILDLLMRISRQQVQIKKLVQELAIQRMRLDALAPPETQNSVRTVESAPALPSSLGPPLLSAAGQVLFLAWLVALLVLNGMLVNERLARWVVYAVAPEATLEWKLKPLLTALYTK